MPHTKDPTAGEIRVLLARACDRSAWAHTVGTDTPTHPVPREWSPVTHADALAQRRAHLAVFFVFAFNGFVFASWASRLPAVRDDLAISPGQLGLVLLIGSAGSVLALPLTGTLVHRFGTRRTTRGAALVNAVGLAGAATAIAAGSTALTAASLFFAFAGIGAWDVAMNLQGTVVEHHLGRAIMPRFHAGFSLGAVAGALAGVLAAAVGVPAPWQIIASALVCATATIALTTAYLPDGTMTATSSSGDRGAWRRAAQAWTEPRTLLIGLMVLSAALTEGSANDWLALAVVDGFSVADTLGAVAFGVFVASMTAMRFAGTGLIDRFGRVPVLRLSAASALIGLLIFGLAPSLPTALMGVILWGFGAALGFPVGMSAASDDPTRSAARVSVVSSIGYVAFLAGPPLLGMLAEHVGYRAALLAITIPLIASVLLSQVAAPLKALPSGGST